MNKFAVFLFGLVIAFGAQAQTVLDFNFEEGNPNPAGTGPLNGLSCNGNCPTLSTLRSRSGSRAMRVYLNRLTSPVSYRTEAVLPSSAFQMDWDRGYDPQDYWIGYSIYFDKWDKENSDRWVNVFNIHGQPRDGWDSVGWCGNSNPFLMSPRQDSDTDGRIHVKIGGGGLVGYCDGVPYPTVLQVERDIGRYKVGEWNDFVIHVKFSHRSNVGFYRIWINGVLSLEFNGPTAHEGNGGPYPKTGIYCNWFDRNLDEPVFERLTYVDDFKIAWGPGDDYYSVVAPGGSAPPPDPDPEDPVKLPVMQNLRIEAPRF